MCKTQYFLYIKTQLLTNFIVIESVLQPYYTIQLLTKSRDNTNKPFP